MPPDPLPSPRLHEPAATADVPAAQVLALLQQQQQLLTLAVALLREKQRPLAREALDAAELAEVLGLGLRSVRSLDSAGMLPKPIRVGSRVLWRVAELRGWLACGAPDRAAWERLRAERRQARARRGRR